MAATPRTRTERDQFAAGQRFAHERLPEWRCIADSDAETNSDIIRWACEQRGSSEMFTLGALDVGVRWWDKP